MDHMKNLLFIFVFVFFAKHHYWCVNIYSYAVIGVQNLINKTKPNTLTPKKEHKRAPTNVPGAMLLSPLGIVLGEKVG